MQERETEQEIQPGEAPADPKSAPLTPVPSVQVEEKDDDPDEIFLKAVAEIDTQPLLRKKKCVVIRFMDVLQVFLCSSLIVGSMAGIVWQVITYPKTLVILYAVEKPASLTATLDLPTRTLAPVTLTRSLTMPATGHRHQDARAASGTLTFYNGNVSSQMIARGTVFTGADGIHVSTDQSVTIPAANPPYFGQATITATTLQVGSTSNMHAYDLNGTVSSSVFVKNLQAFTGGRDARSYRAVAQSDIDRLTSTLEATLAREMPSVFTVAPGEGVYPTQCVSTVTPDHRPGDEASSVTVHVASTCQGRAYKSQEFARQSMAVFARTRPAPRYHVMGSVQTVLVSMSPLLVTIHGAWAYTFSTEYEQDLAQHIQGDTPAQASKYLLHIGVIDKVSISTTLPASMYIQFLVLVG